MNAYERLVLRLLLAIFQTLLERSPGVQTNAQSALLCEARDFLDETK